MLEWFRTVPVNVIPRFYRVAIVGYIISLVVHLGYVVLFGWIGIWPMAILNIGSVCTWCLALFMLKNGRVMLSWMIGVVEITIHSVLAVHYLGAGAGFQFFLFVLAVMSFILPVSQRRILPIPIIQTAAFILLIYYDRAHAPVYALSTGLGQFFLVSNIITTVMAIATTLSIFMRVLERTENALAEAYAQSETLLQKILPVSIAGRLKQRPGTIAESFPFVTVLFADIVDFTRLAERLSPQALVDMLNELFGMFDERVEHHQVEKIKTVGDAYMAAAGVPNPRPDHAEAMARFALDMQVAVARYNASHGANLHLRIGIHSGPVTAGVIGKSRFLYDLWGDAVNTASRMESHGLPGRIQVSDATHALLQEGFIFEDRGMVDLKGKGTTHTWLLLGEQAV